MTPAELADAQEVARNGNASAARILLGVLLQDYLQLLLEVEALRQGNLALTEMLARRTEQCAQEVTHDAPVFTQ